MTEMPTQRRNFLKRTSVAAGAVALSASAIPSVHAAGDETIKVALVGCGGRGTGAASQALNTAGPVKLWAMADVFEDKLKTSLEVLTKGQEQRYDREAHDGFANQIDVAPERQFVGWDAYKQAIDSGVDVVILTTFPHFRPMQYAYAVEQGKHVFMEKPVACDAAGVRQILAANEIAKQKNLKVGVGLQRRHSPLYLETLDRIHGGAIGPIQSMRCYWNSGSAGQLNPRRGETEMEFQMRNKYYFTWLAGDHIVEQHIHNIDICNWMAGGHPVECNGMGGRMWRNGREHGEIYDHHFVEYTYADGTKMHSQCRHIPRCFSSMSEHAQGSKGSAMLDNRNGVIEIAGAEPWKYRGEKVNPYQSEHDCLFDAVRKDLPFNEAEYGAISTMTAIMGRMATYSGKVVQWEDALNSEVDLKPDRYAWDGTPPVVPDADGVYPCAMPGMTKVL
ncbi:Gfo/Idh/MocA family oxidoreductase [Novipirellula artificiosorum]|uniref:Inositol 2-dehydrogenase/D-chiro-inositol 3-dehydrogenase n=1 Tax=Novipirellula artificiosorum TaxID=2528016 RepID=A0A5C6E1Y6_9BACT|nr:Gfo/Idh/MocA family oxidoreductase [Novipirellula artificiosorum]TWU42504.1 Inositol 2-dehydrogenase/D-chiro-inositol 3-dehydrogenase [Novipirellula artificiosorum]